MPKTHIHTLKEVILKVKEANPDFKYLCDMDMTVAKELGILTIKGTTKQLTTILQALRDYGILVAEHQALGNFCDELTENLKKAEEEDDLFAEPCKKYYDA